MAEPPANKTVGEPLNLKLEYEKSIPIYESKMTPQQLKKSQMSKEKRELDDAK